MAVSSSRGSQHSKRSDVIVDIISTVTVAGLLPFVVGAVSIQIRTEFESGTSFIGLLVAVFFAASGITSRLLAVMVRRIGAVPGLMLSATCAGLANLGVALAVGRWMLVVFAVLAGSANTVAQIAANLQLSRYLNMRHIATMFGIKQSSIPVATLLGGLSVPAIAVVFGWRWVFLGAAILSFLVAGRLMLGASPVRRSEPIAEANGVGGGYRIRSLKIVALGAGLGTAAATTFGVFFVENAVSAGMSLSAAGFLAALCSVSGIVARLGAGVLVDYFSRLRCYGLVGLMMLIGAGGLVLLSLSGSGWILVGGLIGYIFGWSWAGILHYAVVRDNSDRVSVATGLLQSGTSLGSAIGPLAFGIIVVRIGFDRGWIIMAAVLLAGGACLLFGSRSGRVPSTV